MNKQSLLAVVQKQLHAEGGAQGLEDLWLQILWLERKGGSDCLHTVTVVDEGEEGYSASSTDLLC